MLGHGHAPSADIAGNVNLALGHGIGHAVGGVAPDNDLGAGVKPADIVGTRTEDVDYGIGESHGDDALSRRSEGTD